MLARYNPDGRLDASFGEEGRVLTPFSTFLRADIATLSWMSTLALQPDGKIVAAGGTYQVNIDAVVLAAARYLSDGSLDTRFGGGGRVIMLARERDSAFGASAIALQGDGKVLVAGGSKGGEYTLARYEGGDLPRCPAALRSGCKGTPGGKGSLTIRQRASRQEDRLT